MGIIHSTIVARKLTKENLINNLDAIAYAFDQILEILCLED